MSWEFVLCGHVPRLNNHHLIGNADSEIMIQMSDGTALSWCFDTKKRWYVFVCSDVCWICHDGGLHDSRGVQGIHTWLEKGNGLMCS